MDYKQEKYILRLAGKMLKAFDQKAVENLMEMGAFHPQDYVFDTEARIWITPSLHESLFKLPLFFEKEAFEKPSFNPPMAPVTAMSKGEVEKLSKEIASLKSSLEEKTSVINVLKTTRKSLEEDFLKGLDKHLQTKEELTELKSSYQNLELDLEKSQSEKESLVEQMENLEGQVEDLLAIKDELFVIKNELNEKQASLVEELQERAEDYRQLQSEVESLRYELSTYNEEKERLLKKQEIYKNYVKTHKKRADSFETNVSKLNQGILKLKDLRKKDKMTISNLENYKTTQSNKEARELNVLIGDSFEIDNSPHWYIETMGEVKGPFSFHDMLSLQKYEKINLDTPVKKKTDVFWNTAGQDFELTANIITHSENINGTEIFRYFVNRSDYRAPFHGSAIIEIDGKEVTGFCTSLSVGGSFIELPKLDLDLMNKGGVATLRINSGTLSQDLVAPVIMRNFSHERPCGIGLQFQSLDDEQRNIIISYVSSYLENSKKTA
jgi:predicted nuclease with TOPRIM domain